jgi:hypothetical protein
MFTLATTALGPVFTNTFRRLAEPGFMTVMLGFV